MKKLQDQEYHDVAENALSYFDELKGPVEVRAAVLKSVGLHIKDLLGAASHLEGATTSIQHPCEQDLEDWVGWNPALMETLKELENARNAEETNIRLDKIDVILTRILQKLRSLEVFESLREEKVNQLFKNFKAHIAPKDTIGTDISIVE